MKLHIERISVSRARAYQQCELYYDAIYNQGYKAKSDPLTFGTIIHEALERYHQDPSKDILDLFDDAWVKHNCTNLDYYKEGREMLNEYLIEPSYHENPIARDANGKPMIEKYFKFPLDKKGKVIASGVIDRIDHISNDTCEIIDYKTSRVPHTREEMEKDEQLSMYNLALPYVAPQYENAKLSLIFLRFKKLTTERTQEELEYVRDFYINLFHQIRLNDDPQPRLNPYCGWCPIKNKGCPLYKELTQEEKLLFGDVPDAPKVIHDQLEDVKTKIKILEGRRSDLEDALKNLITGAGKDYIELGAKKVYLRSRTRSFYPYDAVKEALGEAKAESIVSVPKTEVDRLIRNNESAKEYLESRKVEYYTKPQLYTEEL